MATEKTDVIIIGAGLTGLTAAYYLTKAGKKIKIIEKKNRPGGVIATEKQKGFLYETGPNTGILSNESTARLFHELKDSCNLKFASSVAKKRYVMKNGQWLPLPMSLLEGVTTGLFSLKDKIRLLGEPFRKKGTNENETLDQTVLRRMAPGFLDYAIDPFILGIYAGDPAGLVTKYAFKKLYNLEQNYGSFIGGAIKLAKKRKRQRKQPGFVATEIPVKRQTFSFEGGLSSLIKALVKRLPDDALETGASKLSITPQKNNYKVSYGQKTLDAEKILIAVSSNSLAQVLSFADSNFTEPVQQMKKSDVIQAAVGFNRWNGMQLDGFGGLIPFKENQPILGALFMSALFENRAPEKGALFSVFSGGIRKPEVVQKSDQEIIHTINSSMKKLFGADQPADFIKLHRYQEVIPQYGKESKEKLNKIEQIQNQYEGLYIGGNTIDGIGMADRIEQGANLAQKILEED